MSSNIYDPSTKTLVPIAGNASNSLNMLDDVALSSPSNGQVLTYDAANQVWKNATSSGGGGGGASAVSDLTDVDLDDIQNGQVLKWNSTDEVWENANESGGGSSYTAGNGIDITNDVISTKQSVSGDMDEIVDELPIGGGITLLTQTLTSGSTSVTFTGIPTSGNNIINFYTSAGINYTAIDTATAGQVTLTFDSQSADVVVQCEIKGVL